MILKDKKIVELAIGLHGHLAPGIALGIRMSEIALDKINAKKGNKHLIGICETSRGLADAMQVVTGCTLGHGNAYLEDYGKLALTIANSLTNEGVRVALSDSAYKFSDLMDKWMMRKGRLTPKEEDELGKQLLEIDENYFSIQKVKIKVIPKFESSEIVKCAECGDLIPIGLTKEGICKVCIGEGYYSVNSE